MQAALLCMALAAPAADRSIDFDTDIAPILSKAGCNGGACHGAAAGRGGFHLSLFGGDPAVDYDAIVRQLEGRRINRADPAASLIVAKPTGMLDHGGGVPLEYDGPQAKLLADWIAAGAQRSMLRELESLEVAPANMPLAHVPEDFQLEVTAQFSDGSQRDVTETAVYWPADEGSVQVDPSGHVTVLRAGRQHVFVRYLSQLRVVTITAPLTDTPLGLVSLPRHNWIDDEVNQTLVELGLAPLPRTDDAALLRRVMLDLAGRLPTPAELRAYRNDRRDDKYERLIKLLIVCEDFADYWTYLLGRRFGLGSPTCDVAGSRAFQKWLRHSLRFEVPLDELAREMIESEGNAYTKGAANYHRNRADAGGEAALVAANFMGVQLGCAECHNHPLDRWTQDDFHGLAAVFGNLVRGPDLQTSRRLKVIHPRTGEPAVPRLPGERFIPIGGEPRGELARWLTDRGNPYFARAQVNWIWKQLFGRGIVEPFDDLRDTNPASHPKLLARLAADFADNGFDLRTTIELIVRSEAYRRSASTSESHPSAEAYYAAYPWRPLSPEVLADAIDDAVSQRNVGPVGVPRAISRIDDPQRRGAPAAGMMMAGMGKREDLAEILGRCRPATGCQPSAVDGNQLDQLPTQLMLLAGVSLSGRITEPGAWLPQVLEQEQSNQEVVADMYLRTLGRQMSEREMAHWQAEIGSAKSAENRDKLEDLFWSLLTCREFATNH